MVTLPNNNFSLVDNAGTAPNCKVTAGKIDLSQRLESSTNCVVTVKYDNSTITTGSGNISVALANTTMEQLHLLQLLRLLTGMLLNLVLI